ncbi:MAG: DUF2505 domain-containing protein [Nocardioides sp.]|uniref:DUF2505 domain-containing protein n=1 Tax=Nocardioides sp. TaxID=35761 RepID=UPI0039E626D8
MSTTLSFELTYEATLPAVFTMLTDQSFREQVCDAQGAVHRSVNIGGTPLKVVIERGQPTDSAPPIARRLVASEVTVTQQEVWNSSTAAVVEISTHAPPVDVRGSASLTQNAGRTTQQLNLRISAKIPLVASKVEKIVAEQVRAAYQAEYELGVAYLAER